MTRNIVFDMGNVLSNYNPRKYVESLLRDHDAAEAVARELFGGPEWLLLDAGTLEESEAVSRVQKRIPQFSEAVASAMEHWRCVLEPVPGMPELVDRIWQNGYRLYLLSNVSLRFLKYYREVAMFRHFEGFLISAEEKLVKPDPAIFRRLCEKFGLLASECLFIDDIQENVNAAVRLGFHGYRFTGVKELEQFLTRGNILK